MTRRVSYLARVAGLATRGVVLRPPRSPFGGAAPAALGQEVAVSTAAPARGEARPASGAPVAQRSVTAVVEPGTVRPAHTPADAPDRPRPSRRSDREAATPERPASAAKHPDPMTGARAPGRDTRAPATAPVTTAGSGTARPEIPLVQAVATVEPDAPALESTPARGARGRRDTRSRDAGSPLLEARRREPRPDVPARPGLEPRAELGPAFPAPPARGREQARTRPAERIDHASRAGERVDAVDEPGLRIGTLEVVVTPAPAPAPPPAPVAPPPAEAPGRLARGVVTSFGLGQS